MCIDLWVYFFQVGSIGCLLISGLAEPVVKAYSLVIDLVERYTSSQLTEANNESMEIRRTFKSMVERLEDSHTLDLLVLPVMVKEMLLDLVKQSGIDPSTLDHGVVSAGATKPPQFKSMDRRMLLSDRGVNNAGKQHNQEETPNHFFRRLAGTEPKPGASNIDVKKQDREVQKWSEGVSYDIEGEVESNQEDQHGETFLSTASKQENEHLLKFFTAMGFNDEVVNKVLARTGPREPSQVLDLIQQEQDKTVIQPLEQEVNGAPGVKDEDFVLGVMKKAAASCGYTEEKVAEIYCNVPELKPHELILELQKKGMTESSGKKDTERIKAEEIQQRRSTANLQGANEILIKEERKTDLVHGKNGVANKGQTENDRRVGSEGVTKKNRDVKSHGKGSSKIPQHLIEPGMVDVSSAKANRFPSSLNQLKSHTIPSPVCGPPQPTYPAPPRSEEKNTPVESTFLMPKPKPVPNKAGAVITGQQRFLEGLEASFVLQLKDDHGDPELRQIILDGSNVAMT